MGFSVVVKHHSVPWLLEVCLQSVRHYWPMSQFDYDVVLADEGTPEALLKKFFVRNPDLVDQAQVQVGGTVGQIWNAAVARAKSERIVLLDAHTYLTRFVDPEQLFSMMDEEGFTTLIGTWGESIESHPTDGCLAIHESETYQVCCGGRIFPESGVLYLRDDLHQEAKLWPEGIPKDKMQAWVDKHLEVIGWNGVLYGLARHPFFQTEKNSTDAHVQACCAEWEAGKFCPSFDQIQAGRFPWISRPVAPMRLHYPKHLRPEYFDEDAPRDSILAVENYYQD